MSEKMINYGDGDSQGWGQIYLIKYKYDSRKQSKYKYKYSPLTTNVLSIMLIGQQKLFGCGFTPV